MNSTTYLKKRRTEVADEISVQFFTFNSHGAVCFSSVYFSWSSLTLLLAARIERWGLRLRQIKVLSDSINTGRIAILYISPAFNCASKRRTNTQFCRQKVYKGSDYSCILCNYSSRTCTKEVFDWKYRLISSSWNLHCRRLCVRSTTRPIWGLHLCMNRATDMTYFLRVFLLPMFTVAKRHYFAVQCYINIIHPC